MSIFLNGNFDVIGPALGSLLYTGGGFGLPFFVIGASAFVLACAAIYLLRATNIKFGESQNPVENAHDIDHEETNQITFRHIFTVSCKS